MLARLWWKEWRSLAPIAVTLFLTAAGTQWFLLTYGDREIRNGILVTIALGWAVLYAFVVGSASFAGERENRTLGFLDALPVGRGWLWLGKTSFALGSTAVLAVIFRAIGWIGWRFESPSYAPQANIDQFFAALLIEATIGGLFWSAISKNAITAGILAVVLAGLDCAFISVQAAVQNQGLPLGVFGNPFNLVRVTLWLLALLISWLVVVGEVVGFGRSFWTFGSGGGRSIIAIEPRTNERHSLRLSPAFWRLCWQTWREGRAVWLQTAALILLPLAGLVAGERVMDSLFLLFLVFFALLIQGTSVFVLANSTRTRQFLDNQAVPPHTVWAAKLATWCFGLFVFSVVALGGAFLLIVGGHSIVFRDVRGLGILLSLALNAFTVGIVGGMMFNRRITALLVSCLAALLVILPQIALVENQLVPIWFLLISPALLLLASRVWAADWLADRDRLRRWIRLAGLLIGPFGLVCIGYVAGRAWEITDIGPQYQVPSAADPNLTAEYRILDESVLDESVILDAGPAELMGQPAPSNPLLAPTANQGQQDRNNDPIIIERTKLLSQQPGVIRSIEKPIGSSIQQSLAEPIPHRLVHLLIIDARVLRSRGDLAGAWAEIATLFRIGGQAARGATSVVQYDQAMNLLQTAVEETLVWSRDPRMTRAFLRLARLTLDELTLPRATAAISSESRRIEQSLDLSTGQWANSLSSGDRPSGITSVFDRILNAWLIAPSWERERTRRLVRQVTRIAIENAESDFGNLRSNGILGRRNYFPFMPQGATVYLRTPLVDRMRSLDPLLDPIKSYDHEATNRRLLDTYLALRSWQIAHHGQAPAALAELIPEELSQVPVDPYHPDRALSYEDLISASDMDDLPHIWATMAQRADPIMPVPKHWAILFSVGRDQVRNGRFPTLEEIVRYPMADRTGDDILFILPPDQPQP